MQACTLDNSVGLSGATELKLLETNKAPLLKLPHI